MRLADLTESLRTCIQAFTGRGKAKSLCWQMSFAKDLRMLAAEYGQGAINTAGEEPVDAALS
jgi:hypothetical protein